MGGKGSGRVVNGKFGFPLMFKGETAITQLPSLPAASQGREVLGVTSQLWGLSEPPQQTGRALGVKCQPAHAVLPAQDAPKSRICARALIQAGRIDPAPPEQQWDLWLRRAQGLDWATLNSSPVREKRFWHVQRSVDERWERFLWWIRKRCWIQRTQSTQSLCKELLTRVRGGLSAFPPSTASSPSQNPQEMLRESSWQVRGWHGVKHGEQPSGKGETPGNSDLQGRAKCAPRIASEGPAPLMFPLLIPYQ